MNNDFRIDDDKILIVGLGMIGASYAKSLRNIGIIPYAIDIDEKTIEMGLDLGIVEKFEEENFREIDFVILCLYPQDNIKWLKDNQMKLKKGCLITDVTGIKSFVCNSISLFLRDDIEFIASHPMAGKEKAGIMGSDETIFYNANFIITPTEKNSNKAISKLNDLAHKLKFNNIEILSIEEHDKMISYLSQLTHVIAVCLMNSHETSQMIRYTGDSFRDLTRIAKINENLWSELFLLNKEQLVEDIERFTSELGEFKKDLLNYNEEEIKNKLINSRQKRQLFDKK